MKPEAITGTGLLLAIAIISQSLRVFIPIPPLVSMFVVGTLVCTCLLVALWRYDLKSALIIAWATPIVAFMQGFLPIVFFVPIVGIGNTVYIWAAEHFKDKNRGYALGTAVLGKTIVLLVGFALLFAMISVPDTMKKAVLMAMSWPQLITGTLGFLLAQKITNILKNL